MTVVRCWPAAAAAACCLTLLLGYAASDLPRRQSVFPPYVRPGDQTIVEKVWRAKQATQTSFVFGMNYAHKLSAKWVSTQKRRETLSMTTCDVRGRARRLGCAKLGARRLPKSCRHHRYLCDVRRYRHHRLYHSWLERAKQSNHNQAAYRGLLFQQITVIRYCYQE